MSVIGSEKIQKASEGTAATIFGFERTAVQKRIFPQLRADEVLLRFAHLINGLNAAKILGKDPFAPVKRISAIMKAPDTEHTQLKITLFFIVMDMQREGHLEESKANMILMKLEKTGMRGGETAFMVFSEVGIEPIIRYLVVCSGSRGPLSGPAAQVLEEMSRDAKTEKRIVEAFNRDILRKNSGKDADVAIRKVLTPLCEGATV